MTGYRDALSPSVRSGVSLLEALVAMAIIGASFGAVLQLQAQLSNSLAAVERAEVRAAWSRNATEIVASLQKDEDRTGRIAFGGTTIDWSPAAGSSFVSPNRVGQRMRGQWTVTLAPVDVRISIGGRQVQQETRYAITASLPRPEN